MFPLPSCSKTPILLMGGTLVSDGLPMTEGWVQIDAGLIEGVGTGLPPHLDHSHGQGGGHDSAGGGGYDRGSGHGHEIEVIDVSGHYICPGFVDVHVHGGGGSDVMDGTLSSLANIARTHAAGGTTSLMATTVSAPMQATSAAIRTIAEGMSASSAADAAWPGSRIIGCHLEGPYLSLKYRGAHEANEVRDVDIGELTSWLDVSPGCVRLMTLAPEAAGADEAIALLTSRGVLPVVGHSEASYEVTMRAVSLGMTMCTHVMNAMAPLHHRIPGVVGAVLTSPDVTVQLISDGIHIHPAVVKLVTGCKGFEKTALITDGMAAVGMPDGVYQIGTSDVEVTNGLCRLSDGTIAGSTLTMAKAVANTVEYGAADLFNAVYMATMAPAKAIGLSDHIGSISQGKRADLTLLDASLRVSSTYVGGKRVYTAYRIAPTPFAC